MPPGNGGTRRRDLLGFRLSSRCSGVMFAPAPSTGFPLPPAHFVSLRKATVSVKAFEICSFKVIIILLDLFVNRFEPTIFSKMFYNKLQEVATTKCNLFFYLFWLLPMARIEQCRGATRARYRILA